MFECVGAPGLIQRCIEIARRAMLVPVGVCEQPDTICRSGLIKELSMQLRYRLFTGRTTRP